MNTAGIRSQLVTILSTVSGVTECVLWADSVGTTPAIHVGKPKGHYTPGASRQEALLEVPVRVYVGKIADETRNQGLLDPILDAINLALAPYNTNTGYWTVIESIDFDTDKSYGSIAGEAYSAIDITIHMLFVETVNTYAAH